MIRSGPSVFFKTFSFITSTFGISAASSSDNNRELKTVIDQIIARIDLEFDLDLELDKNAAEEGCDPLLPAGVKKYQLCSESKVTANIQFIKKKSIWHGCNNLNH